jgi:hypothetical protein
MIVILNKIINIKGKKIEFLKIFIQMLSNEVSISLFISLFYIIFLILTVFFIGYSCYIELIYNKL